MGGDDVGSVGSIVALSLLFGVVLGTTGVLGASAVAPSESGVDDPLAALDPFDDQRPTADVASASGRPNASESSSDGERGAARERGADSERGTQVPSFPRRSTAEWERLPHVEERDPGHVIVETDDSRVHTEHVERYVADAVDEYRSAEGLEPWPYSYALASTARGHSYDMYDREFFAHENPDGEQAWDRWGSSHCSARFGENVAKTYLDRDARDAHGDARRYSTARDLAEATLELWKTSAPHDELLRSEWPEAAGVGVYVDEYADGGYVVYVTLNVCATDASETS